MESLLKFQFYWWFAFSIFLTATVSLCHVIETDNRRNALTIMAVENHGNISKASHVPH